MALCKNKNVIIAIMSPISWVYANIVNLWEGYNPEITFKVIDHWFFMETCNYYKLSCHVTIYTFYHCKLKCNNKIDLYKKVCKLAPSPHES